MIGTSWKVRQTFWRLTNPSLSFYSRIQFDCCLFVAFAPFASTDLIWLTLLLLLFTLMVEVPGNTEKVLPQRSGHFTRLSRLELDQPTCKLGGRFVCLIILNIIDVSQRNSGSCPVRPTNTDHPFVSLSFWFPHRIRFDCSTLERCSSRFDVQTNLRTSKGDAFQSRTHCLCRFQRQPNCKFTGNFQPIVSSNAFWVSRNISLFYFHFQFIRADPISLGFWFCVKWTLKKK